MTKAVAYARVSSKEQEKEGYSIPAQLKLISEYSASKGIQVVKDFVDIETAKHSGRGSFSEMVQFLKFHKNVRSVLVEKTDRLYRNLRDWVILDELSVQIHFVKENVVFSKDSKSMEKFIHGIKVLMAKNYIDNLSEETKKGQIQKAESGIWPSRAPLGYRNVEGAHGKKIIEPDPAYAQSVRFIFEQYSTGQYSLKQLAAKVQAQGLRLKGRNHIYAVTIQKILKNAIYRGDFIWKGKLYAGSHEPIVDRELWHRAQEIMAERHSVNHHPQKYNFAYSGLVSCGHCGCAFTAEKKKGRYIYYHCTGNKGRCSESYVREEVLSSEFSRSIAELRMDEKKHAWIVQALRESQHDEKEYHEKVLKKLRADYDRIRDRLNAMYVDKLDGIVDAEFFQQKATEWKLEQEKIREQINRHEKAEHTYLREGIKLLELTQRAQALFDEQPAEERARLLKYVCSNSAWKNGGLTVHFRKPFDIIALMHREITAEVLTQPPILKESMHGGGVRESNPPHPPSDGRHWI